VNPATGEREREREIGCCDRWQRDGGKGGGWKAHKSKPKPINCETRNPNATQGERRRVDCDNDDDGDGWRRLVKQC